VRTICALFFASSRHGGNWENFKSVVPNLTLCADNGIVCVEFMTPDDVELFINILIEHGLTFLHNDESVDIAVVDQNRGLTKTCYLIEFDHVNMNNRSQRVAACRLTGSEVMQVVTPPDWVFEKSLSSSHGFVPTEYIDKGMKYLRLENGVDVYLNPLTGKEVYIGRTQKV